MLACFKHTMREAVARTWGWDESFQDASFARQVRTADCVVFESGSTFAGFAAVERHAHAWTLQMLCLMPALQRLGHGTRWLQALKHDAACRGVPVHLHVMKVNPAQLLYERLGFEVIGEDGAVYEMALAP